MQENNQPTSKQKPGKNPQKKEGGGVIKLEEQTRFLANSSQKKCSEPCQQ